MKAIVIGITLLLALIGGGVVLLGGGAVYVSSNLESRAAEIEKEMMAEAIADAPHELTETQIALLKTQVQKLARVAAKMEMGVALTDRQKATYQSEVANYKTGIATAQSRFNDYHNEGDQPSNFDADAAEAKDSDWEMGEPVEADEY